ncbi:hypothetical protein [Hydrogenophaga sp. PAMC20947]|uniref:hypothetical protein n=1 Tax=Hydrogenophaga sp. PAMC20947 TaxID=2565558 RepID=UPI001445F9DE|nr:hypothetical protein [Hydrogenophaga sp. PAMC20947]
MLVEDVSKHDHGRVSTTECHGRDVDVQWNVWIGLLPNICLPNQQSMHLQCLRTNLFGGQNAARHVLADNAIGSNTGEVNGHCIWILLTFDHVAELRSTCDRLIPGQLAVFLVIPSSVESGVKRKWS